MSNQTPMVVVETPEFLSTARRILSEEARSLLIGYLASNPLAGVAIPGTGGVRKLRWALEGRGKRGGARVIYFFHNETMPLFLLTAFAKNERADLSQSERNGLRRVAELLVNTYSRRGQR